MKASFECFKCVSSAIYDYTAVQVYVQSQIVTLEAVEAWTNLLVLYIIPIKRNKAVLIRQLMFLVTHVALKFLA